MAGRTGLEPATSCVTGRHSNQTELPALVVLSNRFVSLLNVESYFITQPYFSVKPKNRLFVLDDCSLTGIDPADSRSGCGKCRYYEI